MRISARGWCYQLEGFAVITKAQFDRAERVINDCRQLGLLPIDFVAEEESRAFSGVERPEQMTPQQYLSAILKDALRAEEYYAPDWWDGEDYYIQMVVEKIDVKTLFEPICKKYHIPIATSRGWSSMLQRAEYARRFKEAEDRGLSCVLLYCGDHDPDGLRISDRLRKNLEDLKEITWADGTQGYDPKTLAIERFGLNFDFIESNKLTWIDNLYTGSPRPCPQCGLPMRLDDPHHPNNKLEYVQKYIREIGVRKCEANALVVRPREAAELCESAITEYLGEGASSRFQAKRQKIRNRMKRIRDRTGLTKTLSKVLQGLSTNGSS